MKIDKKNFFRKYSALIGIFLITVAAFVGFNAVFDEFKLSIGVQAVTAAFGALFIILSTKYLMEQESESKLISEKRRVIFDDSLNEYKRSAKLMAQVLEDNKVSLIELTKLQQQHIQLILLGSREAVKYSREFINECQQLIAAHIADEGTSDLDETLAAELEPEQKSALWKINLKYLAAARSGLELPEDDFNREEEQAAFEGIIAGDLKIKESVQAARAPLDNGIQEWLKLKNISPEIGEKLGEFISILKYSNSNLEEKYTKSLISFQNTKHKNNQNIFYISGVTKKGVINCSIYGGTDEGLCVEMSEKLKSFDAKLVSRTQNNRTNFGVKLRLEASQVTADYVRPLTDAILESIERVS